MKFINIVIAISFLLYGCNSSGQKQIQPLAVSEKATQSGSVIDSTPLERVKQHLVAPPLLPIHDQVARGGSKIVQVRLVAREKTMDIGNGAKIQAATYNGSIPGPAIVVHEGDYVELTLVNPPVNTMQHNIDLHAATGALGGGELTKVSPGQQMVLRFKATKPGVFVYHCATGGPMIPYHVVSGMNGVIMVLPREGLKDAQGHSVHYDRAYYIGEQDFYVPKDENGVYRRYDTLPDALEDTLQVMQGLVPSHVVFNGAVGALTKANHLTANVGETVLFIHSQANRDTRPHLIGGHGDLVWETGSFSDQPATNLETWLIRGGSAGAMLYQFKQPGTYVYLNHNLIEAVMLGAAAHIKVDGKWDNDLMTQVVKPELIKYD
ncbi:MAG: nitrite reductase, copper-containing [Gammaproteobacteria bacterium]|nr:nitrite reductase, copper-containing [Gammaproteobacteria bacterium]